MTRAALHRTIGTLTAGILTAGMLAAGLIVPGPASAAAAGPHWSVVPSPNAPGAPDDQLSAVSCTRATACMAVGYASRDIFVNNVLVRKPIARAWNGRRWARRRVPAPPGAVASMLSGVSCASATACTAVGQSMDSSGGSVPLAEAWNGATWAVRAVPVPAAGSGVLTSVSCASARACMAVGYTGNFQLPLAARWNGATWTVRILPFPPSAVQNPLTGVSCTSPTACTAIGQAETEDTTTPLAERWDGATWTIQHVPVPAARKVVLTAVSCTSATACTAVGRISRANDRIGLRAEHWNGTRWAVRPGTRLPFGSGDVNALSCTSARACTAVVNRLRSFHGSFNGRVAALVERWNGGEWIVQRTPGAARKRGRNLLGVSCTSARRCKAVGYFAKAFAKVALAERWNGRRWRIKPTPGDPGRVASNVLAGISCASASACLAVGSYNPRQNISGFSKPLAERWNGTRWAIKAVPSPTKDSLLAAISCRSARHCTAVGSFRTQHRRPFRTKTLAQRWNGRRWRIQVTRNPRPNRDSELQAVSCGPGRACMAVGFRERLRNGSVPAADLTMAERWNGRRWIITHPRNAPHTVAGRLFGVSCTSARSCEAVGGGVFRTSSGGLSPLTLAERWNGRGWVMQHVPVPAGANGPSLAAVSCTSARACTAVGSYEPAGASVEAGLVERWNGTSWAIQPFPAAAGGVSSFLTGVSCTSASACAAAGTVITSGNGRAPLAAAWNGVAWVIQPAPEPSGLGGQAGSLSGLSCTSSAACAAAGSASFSDVSRTLTERYSPS